MGNVVTTCPARTPRTGSHTTSWAGDHHCRHDRGHDGVHECTCGHTWDTPTRPTTRNETPPQRVSLTTQRHQSRHTEDV